MLMFINNSIKNKNLKSKIDFNDTYDDSVVREKLATLNFYMLAMMGLFCVNLLTMFFYYNNKLSLQVANAIAQIFSGFLILAGMCVLPSQPGQHGFNLNKLKMNITYGILFGFIGFMFAVLVRIYLIQNGIHYFKFSTDNIFLNVVLNVIVYPIFVIIQESATKGYFQTFFIKMYDHLKYNRELGIVISSLLFALFHIMLGIEVFICVFIFSVLLGIFYEKSRSLVGVLIIHYMTGFGLFFLSN